VHDHSAGRWPEGHHPSTSGIAPQSSQGGRGVFHYGPTLPSIACVAEWGPGAWPVGSAHRATLMLSAVTCPLCLGSRTWARDYYAKAGAV